MNNKKWIGLCIVMLLSGCSMFSGKSPKEQDKAAVEARDVTAARTADASRPDAAQAGASRQGAGQSGAGGTAAGDATGGGAAEVRALDGGAGGSDASGKRAGSAMGKEGIEGSVKGMLADPASALAKRAVYYDFDRYNIKPEFEDMLKAHGQFLAAHKNVEVRVEGNCDERGSREYNLALGQRRADAVRKAFMLMGVSEAQVRTVSYGSEKPRADGHDEDAWAQNRRSDIIYPDFDAKP